MGGLGLGRKLNSYKLQNIASSELGITKYEYAAEGYANLDQFYLKDPLNGKETLEERKKKIAYYEKPES